MTEIIPRSRGDRYALSALKRKRATIASDIVQLERQLRHRRDSLVHVDATLKLLDPDTDPEAIPTKRPVRRVKLFRQGELGRMILGALRNAVGEMPTAAIVDAVLEAGGHGEGARRAMAGRVRGNSPTSKGGVWWSRAGKAGVPVGRSREKAPARGHRGLHSMGAQQAAQKGSGERG